MTASRVLSGTAASDGIAIGPAHLLVPPVIVVERQISRDLVPVEVARLISAVTSTDERLAVRSSRSRSLSARLESEHLHEGHLLLEAHRMMLSDDEIVGGTRRLIESDGIAAEGAVRRVIDAIAAKFGRMEDPYLRERRADIEAIGDRLLRTLLGLPEVSTDSSLAPGTIGVGSILSPIDALHLPRSGMVGFAAERGGKTSHASIILRAFEIPFVVGVRGLRTAVHPGDRLVVDGSLGEVIVNPDDDAIKLYEQRRDRERSRLQALKSRGTGPVVTRDGVRIELCANIEALSEVSAALEFGPA